MLIIYNCRTLRGFTALLRFEQNTAVAHSRAFSKHVIIVKYCNMPVFLKGFYPEITIFFNSYDCRVHLRLDLVVPADILTRVLEQCVVVPADWQRELGTDWAACWLWHGAMRGTTAQMAGAAYTKSDQRLRLPCLTWNQTYYRMATVLVALLVAVLCSIYRTFSTVVNFTGLTLVKMLELRVRNKLPYGGSDNFL